MRDAFGQRTFLLPRVRIQMIMNPRQDALLTSSNKVNLFLNLFLGCLYYFQLHVSRKKILKWFCPDSEAVSNVT